MSMEHQSDKNSEADRNGNDVELFGSDIDRAEVLIETNRIVDVPVFDHPIFGRRSKCCVKITHLPTGIVVENCEHRSGHRNKEEALNLLKARLHEFILNSTKID